MLHRIDPDQCSYVQTILTQFQMADCKGIWTPMESNSHQSPWLNHTDIINASESQSKVGSIMYDMLGSRRDLAYTICTLSKHNNRPTRSHHTALQRVFHYLQQTQYTAIRYEYSKTEPPVFPKMDGCSDSDWAGDKDQRSSTSGYVFSLCGRAILRKSRKQDVVATSTTEAEYVGLTEAAKESVWLRRLLIELESRVARDTTLNITGDHLRLLNEQLKSLDTGPNEITNDCVHKVTLTSTTPQTIYADNQGAIKLSHNPQFHARTKHIDIRYHYIRTARQRNEVLVAYIPTMNMTADILTKALISVRYGASGAPKKRGPPAQLPALPR